VQRVSTQLASHWPAIPPPIRLPLYVSPAHPCSYLPNRAATMRGFIASQMPGNLYQHFMDAGFRRSGDYFYQPVCRGCRQCIPIRVPVDEFRPNKSQRRCARRNRDLVVTISEPKIDDERFALYARYKSLWHNADDATLREFESFLYTSPVPSVEFAYRAPNSGGRLLAIGICDVCPGTSLSSVYFFFDPGEARRGLGTFGVLREIEFARDEGLANYYLGYLVEDCRSMAYKAAFAPCEVLGTDGIWRKTSIAD
jgi:arginine-tRNA-protein transferase